ncbi:MAG: hypothetical protein IBX40_12240 [Methanosarcinales archaeon]|nr:hypothetical protein [Methanosarcinales archaeon]
MPPSRAAVAGTANYIVPIKLLRNYISTGSHTHPNTKSSALNKPPRLIEKHLPAPTQQGRTESDRDGHPGRGKTRRGGRREEGSSTEVSCCEGHCLAY